jgi:hypothetical protein
MIEASEYRDGSYWLTPEMYVSNEDFYDSRGAYLNYEGLDPGMTLYPFYQYLTYWDSDEPDAWWKSGFSFHKLSALIFY